MSQLLKAVNIRGSHVIAIILIASAVFLAGLNRIPVPTVDGAVRASMARELIDNGSLWPVTYEGKVFTDHPPLFIWLTALSYKIFGVNDFAANLVSRLFACLTVLVTGLIALEAGFTSGVALASAIILCTTRDFVLSSVRGYIEPVLEFFTYSGLLLSLCQKHGKTALYSAGSGVAIWLAAFSKGPVAAWPFLLAGGVLVLQVEAHRRVRVLSAYIFSFLLCTLIWAAWVTNRGDWIHWRNYFFGQVLSSALEGRGGAQAFEPSYFVKILCKYYWPWLPLMVWSFVRTATQIHRGNRSASCKMTVVFLVTASGFLGGFSMVKWKFWYYIAPAYPALALFIAAALKDFYQARLDQRKWAKAIATMAAVWIAACSVFPIELHKERVPEVLAFKESIVNSPLTGPVWYVRNTMDHNMIGTSGRWYFNRSVLKIEPNQERSWETTELRASAWIIMGADAWPRCNDAWCKRSTLVQQKGKSALVYYQGVFKN